MSELRFDPIKRHWVIIAGQRALRPSEFKITIETMGEVDCPFCPGHEHKTPDAILTIPGSQQGSWAARLIPNKFPALDLVGESVGETLPNHSNREGRGRHEVMIESALHGDRQAQYTDSHLALLLSIYQSRLRLFTSDSNCRIQRWGDFIASAYTDYWLATGSSCDPDRTGFGNRSQSEVWEMPFL
jgi:UDPglucose--hexose-1-phosphate uridylyltransferase